MATPIETITQLLPASRQMAFERWACDTRWIAVLGPKLKNWWLYIFNSQGLLTRGKTYTFKYSNGPRVSFRAGTSDVLINVEVFGFECYAEAFRSGAASMNRVIDLGAQTGVFTLYALNKNPRLQVVCVEPISENFALLSENIAQNGYTAQVQMQHAAAWSMSGESVTLNMSEQNTGGHSVVPGHLTESLRSETVTTISLRDLVQGEPCDVLKIDIEGAEYEVLMKADSETLSLISHIVGEVHGSLEKKESLLEFLRANHFDVHSEGLTFWASRIS